MFTCPDWTSSGRTVIRWPPHPRVWLFNPENNNSHRTRWHTWGVRPKRSCNWRLPPHQFLHFCCGGAWSLMLLQFPKELFPFSCSCSLMLLTQLFDYPCVFLWKQNNDPSHIRSGPEETLLSHLLVFEAERSRLQSRVVHCGETNQQKEI